MRKSAIPSRFLYKLLIILLLFNVLSYWFYIESSGIPTNFQKAPEHQLLPSHDWIFRPIEEKCQPARNVGFLKNHKCASSTIQNILFRYGLNHNLYFALPNTYLFFGNLYSPFKADMVRGTPWFKLGVNIFAIHTKWDHQEIKSVMPRDTMYITIVRDPAEMFESLYVYMQWEKKYNQSISEYVAHHEVEENRPALGYNQMTWDFGASPSEINNLTAVKELIQRADREFHLVMLMERMEESLVLMSHLLCWDLADVVALKVNARYEKLKTSMSPEKWALLKKRLASDYLLYNHFAERFDGLVEAYGRDRMEKDVRRLRQAASQIMESCSFTKKTVKQLKGANKPVAPGIYGYELKASNSTCKELAMTELNFINMLRDRQKKELMAKFGDRS